MGRPERIRLCAARNEVFIARLCTKAPGSSPEGGHLWDGGRARGPFSAAAESKTHWEGVDMRTLQRLWKDEEGQDLVEYGLLLVLVSLGAVAAMGTLASAISDAFGNAQTNLSSS